MYVALLYYVKGLKWKFVDDWQLWQNLIQMQSFMSIGTTIIQLHEFNKRTKKKNMDKMGNFGQKWYYSAQFGIATAYIVVLTCVVLWKLE